MATIVTRPGAGGRKSYQVRWRDELGRQQSETFRRHGDALARRAQVELGIVPTPDASAAGSQDQQEDHSVPALRTVLDQWRAARRVSNHRRVTEQSLARHLEPVLNNPVDAIRPSDVRTLLAALVDRGYAAETVSAVLRLLRQVLDAAVDDELVVGNAAARVRAPTIRRPPLDACDVLDADQTRRLVEAVPREWRALVSLLAYCGPRWSEALAVTAADVDLLRGRVHLGHRVVEEVNGVTRVREGGKTRGSDRWVPLPRIVRDELERHLTSVTGGPGQLLFVTRAGTPPLRSNFRRRVWQAALRTADVPTVTTRNLRHGAASLMLAAGLDPLEVARRLGHSKPSTTTDVYARLIPKPDTESDPYDDALTRSFGNSLGTPGAVKGA